MVKPSATYAEKLKAVRELMQSFGLDAYIVPRADEYQGEFVAPYAERLKWLTGFTGSGGTALIFKDKALALTDGRYLIQIKDQVDNDLFETGENVKKSTADWLEENVSEKNVIGYDPLLHTPKQIAGLSKACSKKGAILKPIEGNLIDEAWEDQPPRPQGQVIAFPKDIAGSSVEKKIAQVVKTIKTEKAQAFVFTLPDSIAWLLNVRGNDLDYIPSVLSYLIISHRGNVRWFVSQDKVTDGLVSTLPKSVMICPPGDIGLQFMALAQASIEAEKPILMDERYTPIHLKNMLDERGASVRDCIDPSIKPKAKKTSSEIDAIRKAHIHDGVALVKFLKWLEEEGVGQTEISVSEKLNEFRTQNNAYAGPSFPTIAGYGSNGAIVHYRASDKTNKTIEEGGLLLVDSGGQYAADNIFGTTDITRTIAIGKPTDEMRENFTRVLIGHIAVAQANFPKGTIGAQIDALARKPLWDVGLDYAHGTGHGVGCYLAVHEEAASISPKGKTEFAAGMLISNEPGYYKEGEYGIRIENLVLVQEKGKMQSFETVSFAPIDMQLVDASLLDASEREWFNKYHREVYEKLSPLLDQSHQEWLADKTTALA